jgi:hypothetical protein
MLGSFKSGQLLRRSYLWPCIIALFALSTWPAQSGLASTERMSLSQLPLPVQTYVLKEAVGSGVKNPNAILSNQHETFQIPGVQNSNLNKDGQPDYFVSLCMFDLSTPEFRTNGFPCAFGNLIISNKNGGYDFLDIAGTVIGATSGKEPRLVITQRNGGTQCKDYLCDYLYRLKVDKFNVMSLKLDKTCEANACLKLLPASAKSRFAWEGVWAEVNKAQCKCGLYEIDACAAGKGLPPLKLDRKEVIGPEISCDIKKAEVFKDDEFKLIGECHSEGNSAKATIVGRLFDSKLFVSFTGEIENYWGQGDYTNFSIKCR